MRRLVATCTLSFLATILAPSAHAQLLQANQGSNGLSGAVKSVTVTLSKPATINSQLNVQVTSTCTTVPTIKDSLGNVFTTDPNELGSNGGVFAYHAANKVSGADTITATFTTACNYAAIFVEEVNGLSGTIDSHIANTTSALNGSTFTIGTLATSGADFVVSVASDNYGIGGLSAQTGNTLVPADQSPAAAQYVSVTTNGLYLASFGLKQPGYKVTGLSIAYAQTGAPPPPKQVPVAFNLTDINGNFISGMITLYSDDTSGATVVKTPVTSCTLANGACTTYLIVAPSGWFEYDLSNGPIVTSMAFMPGAFSDLLSTASLITVHSALNPADGQPVKPYSIAVQ